MANEIKGKLTPNRVRVSKIQLERQAELIALEIFVYPTDVSQLVMGVVFDGTNVKPGKLIAFSAVQRIESNVPPYTLRLPIVETPQLTAYPQACYWMGIMNVGNNSNPPSYDVDLASARPIAYADDFRISQGYDFGKIHTFKPYGIAIKPILA